VLLHVVADFGAQDLAFAEVGQRLLTHLPTAQIVCTPVPAFATLAAGFVTAQLAAAPAPPGSLVFVNVAPRRDDTGVRVDNDGERLLWTRTPSGVDVVGVDAGHTFSFLAELVDDVRVLTGATRGSQFRSRDLFPDAVARVVAGDAGVFGARVSSATLPTVPEGRVAYVDGFGNLKTTWRWGSLPTGLAPGDAVRVTIGDARREGLVAGGAFAVPEGTLAVAPGSSGYTLRSGDRVRWVEVFARGASASAAFGGVQVGDAVALSPL
jgi:S-adenosylmethionine hydrolase